MLIVLPLRLSKIETFWNKDWLQIPALRTCTRRVLRAEVAG